MYDMKPMAESLASQGRYGDSMLVHMNPVEVAGLRAAAQKMGGDLTTNPRTGQPEAFLPFLLGMGLQGLGMSALGAGIATGLGTAAMTKDLGQGLLAGLGAYGGAGMGEGLSAAGAAGTTAGTAGAAGSGLSTTGAENLLSSTAQATPQTFTAPGAGDLMRYGGSEVAGVGPQSFAPDSSLLSQAGRPPSDLAGISFSGPQSFAPSSFPTPPMTGAEIMGQGGGMGTGIEMTQFGVPQTTTGLQANLPPIADTGSLAYGSDVTGLGGPTGGGPITGLKNVLSTGETGTAAREAFMQGVGGEKGLLGYTAAGLAPYAFEQPGVAGYEGQKSLIRPFDYDPETREFTERTPYTAPGPEYMADGGIVERNQYNYDPNTQMFSKVEPVASQATNPLQSLGGAFSQMGSMFGGALRPLQRATMNSDDPDTQRANLNFNVLSKAMGTGFNAFGKLVKPKGSRQTLYEYSYDPQTQMFTEVPKMAQGGLTGYKEGNILRGQGDGMSDEIEASIGGEQDVLLSDGEYVVPADAVAMLGNGSTDAGANRLDEMIARLRMKKYGRDKQPPEMKAESVMPV